MTGLGTGSWIPGLGGGASVLLASGVSDSGIYLRLLVDSSELGGSGFGGCGVFGCVFCPSGLNGDWRDWESTCWTLSEDYCGYTKLGITPSTANLDKRGAIQEHTLAATRCSHTATVSCMNLLISLLCHCCSFWRFSMRQAKMSFL